MRLVTAEEMQALDRATIEGHGVPGHVLMERAGSGATDILWERFGGALEAGGSVLVLAGKGNNGGDGFVIARLLRERGAVVECALLGQTTDIKGEDASRNARAFEEAGGEILELTAEEQIGQLEARARQSSLVVDAVFGTGLNSPVRGLPAAAIDAVNACGIPVFAVDMPSGLNADTGQPLGSCIRAAATATFGFAKVGQLLYPGAELVGDVAVVDIGIVPEAETEHPPRCELIGPPMLLPFLPRRRPDAHKGHCGHVLVISGSLGKTGAAHLVSTAALRAGAGLVTLAVPSSIYGIFAGGVREVMTETLPDRAGRLRHSPRALAGLLEGRNALAVGPGIGTHADARRAVQWLLRRSTVPMVFDADALTCIAQSPRVLIKAEAPVILTPHPGEMGRLLGTSPQDVQADRVGCARDFARRYACHVVLKGARTVIANPEGHCWINATGNSGMASGGMGDALTGMIAALLGQGLDPADAARLGTYLHGAAGDLAAADIGPIGLIARDVIERVPRALRDLLDLVD